MRKLLLSFLLCSAAVSSFAVSYITRNGIRYRYNTAKTEVYVTVLTENKVYVGDIEVPATIVNSTNDTIPVVGVYSSAFADCENLTSVKLASSVKAIGDYAFDGCTGLKSVEMPGVETIGHWSFRNCYVLEGLKFGDNLKTIGNYCFDKNLKMEVFELPASVTNIGGYVVEGCPALKKVICHGTTPPEVKKGYLDGEEIWTIFDDNDYGTAELFVPESAIPTYKATKGWLQFGNRIYPLSSSATEMVTSEEENQTVEYFNLQGVRVDNPSTGLYIRRQGNKVSKILLK